MTVWCVPKSFDSIFYAAADCESDPAPVRLFSRSFALSLDLAPSVSCPLSLCLSPSLSHSLALSHCSFQPPVFLKTGLSNHRSFKTPVFRNTRPSKHRSFSTPVVFADSRSSCGWINQNGGNQTNSKACKPNELTIVQRYLL